LADDPPKADTLQVNRTRMEFLLSTDRPPLVGRTTGDVSIETSELVVGGAKESSSTAPPRLRPGTSFEYRIDARASQATWLNDAKVVRHRDPANKR